MAALLAIVIVFILIIQFYHFKPTSSIKKENSEILFSLGDSSNLTGDVPVGSIVIYNDQIIGTGFNTFNRNGDIGGHAEINAISSAIKKTGIKNFRMMNRDSLFLITTYEPCKMCVGAILEYNIKNVIFEKPKSISERTKSYMREFRYEVQKTWSGTDTLQELLFMRNDEYRKQKENGN